MRGPFFALVVACALACTVSCSPTTIKVSTLQLRAAAAPDAWANLSAEHRQLVTAGKLQAGMSEGAIFLVRGMPLLWWETKIGGATCRALLYSESDIVTNAIYTCDGILIRQTNVEPTLPCWRVSKVGKRIVADINYFETLSLERQWEIVAGLLRRGQAERDVTIAFGKPYNKGSESREDGSDVGTSVYLAEGGETYGLYVNFIDKRVIGWKIPADRRLTPEAQARRLEATEKRLMSQLKEMEANATKRHIESVELLNAVLDGQEEMKENIGATEEALASATVVGAGGGGSGGGSSTSTSTSTKSCPSGTRTFRQNDCTYTEIPGHCDMGKKCNNLDLLCGSEYACSYISSNASSGICLPAASKYSTCDKPRYSLGPKCRRAQDCEGKWKGSKCKQQKGKKYGYCMLLVD